MNSPKRWLALGVGAVLCLGGIARADNVQAELSALKTRIAELESKQGQNWLNERRAEEVKGLIRDVLADADTRSSLLEGGMTAGHNGKHFFLASEDGSFLMEISGQLDFRYYANFRDHSGPAHAAEDLLGPEDDGLTGFQTGHDFLNFVGHVANPRLGYNIRLALDPFDNDTYFLRAYVSYAFSDNFTLWIGERENPFLREENTEDSNTLAVERSVVHSLFTLGHVQGLGVEWSSDMVKAAVTISDGIRSGEAFGNNYNLVAWFNDFNVPQNDKVFTSDDSDFAITGRVDVRLLGNWNQMEDYTSWGGEDTAAFVGGGIHYEKSETGNSNDNDDFLSWTLDGSIETNGFGLFGAIVGVNTNFEDSDNDGSDLDAYGFVIQANYNINDKWEPFIRYEDITVDYGTGAEAFHDNFNLWTFGVNWYLNKNNAKATLDVVYAVAPVPEFGADSASVNAVNIGLLPDNANNDGQVVVRAKFQLLF